MAIALSELQKEKLEVYKIYEELILLADFVGEDYDLHHPKIESIAERIGKVSIGGLARDLVRQAYQTKQINIDPNA